MSNPNESIFPTRTRINDLYFVDNGLTKREYFAVAAMQGLLASDVITEYKTTAMSAEQITEMAVEHADKLLLALEKEKS